MSAENIPQVGDRVYYYSEHDTIVSGILAEREVSPLTGNPKYRVVDFHSEIKDPEAGKWVDIGHVKGIHPSLEAPAKGVKRQTK